MQFEDKISTVKNESPKTQKFGPTWKLLGTVALDALLVTLALYGAFALRFNFDIRKLYFHQFLVAIPFFVLVRIVLFWRFNVYRTIPRYASTTDVVNIFTATTLGTLILTAINGMLVPLIPAVSWLYAHEERVQRISLAILIIEWALTMIFVGGVRVVQRILHSGILRRRQSDNLRRVLIVGAGDAGEAVARQMRTSPNYLPVAFVDDDPTKLNRLIHGLPVAGTIEQLPELIERFDIDEVLVAIPGIRPGRLNEIVTLCEHEHVSFKILPSVHDVLAGRVSLSRIRPVEIEDLLEREEVELELPPEKNYLADETVLVTGAGGSIGSELCRQILRLGVKRLILFGHGENSIYEILTELNGQYGDGRVEAVIGDIRDERKVFLTFERTRPSIIFHAAAHKHVPLMEYDPDEAVKNNIFGTLNVARAAHEFGAKKFILISSDKAVRPTNVMGATKRVAEMLIFCLANESKTQFVAVRFGNVLGSRGSVVPLFRRQIAQGGPLTLTHPDVTRFFMTIPEAVALVIQAGAMNEQRRLYLLDMGKPVKILDLARRLIKLSGFDPDVEIPIKFTGLRPGEKLHEELLTAGENVKRTDVGKLFITEPDVVDCSTLWETLNQLRKAAQEANSAEIRKLLKSLVPDYEPTNVPEQRSTPAGS